MSKIIDGRKIARDIRIKLRDEISKYELDPGLTAILVGENEASKIYVDLKERAAKYVGVRFTKIKLPESTTQQELLKIIKEQNEKQNTHAILVQLPLPKHINANTIIKAIKPEKDVDGFHPENSKNYINGTNPNPPVLTSAILSLIDTTHENLKNKHAVILANNPQIFAPPIAHALEKLGVTQESARPDEKETTKKLQSADIIIVAVGRPNFITPEKIKKGVMIIDIGTNKVDGKIIGDVDPETDKKAAWRSPSPGGVGPVTVANLLRSTVICYRNQVRL